jgi:hypothetical protein
VGTGLIVVLYKVFKSLARTEQQALNIEEKKVSEIKNSAHQHLAAKSAEAK